MVEKDVWLVYTNTDLTEGRGKEILKAACEYETTAKRIGNGGYVQGTDCPIEKGKIFLVGHRFYVPGYLEPPTPKDVEEQCKNDLKKRAIEKAKAAGLTDEDIELLK